MRLLEVDAKGGANHISGMTMISEGFAKAIIKRERLSWEDSPKSPAENFEISSHVKGPSDSRVG